MLGMSTATRVALSTPVLVNLPALSRSLPHEPKAVAARPVTKGKLLRPGGPGGGPSKLSHAARRPVPAAQPLPRPTPQPAAVPQPATQSRIVPQPVAAAAAAHTRNESTGSMRAPPPPPPAAPPAAKEAHCKGQV